MTIQLTLDKALAEAERDRGMKQATDHADAVTPNWSNKAFEMLRYG